MKSGTGNLTLKSDETRFAKSTKSRCIFKDTSTRHPLLQLAAGFSEQHMTARP
jgi:hypothetical protein